MNQSLSSASGTSTILQDNNNANNVNNNNNNNGECNNTDFCMNILDIILKPIFKPIQTQVQTKLSNNNMFLTINHHLQSTAKQYSITAIQCVAFFSGVLHLSCVFMGLYGLLTKNTLNNENINNMRTIVDYPFYYLGMFTYTYDMLTSVLLRRSFFYK
eukprot:Pgem_evm1s19127